MNNNTLDSQATSRAMNGIMPPEIYHLHEMGVRGFLNEAGIVAVWDWVKSAIDAGHDIAPDIRFPARPPALAPDGVYFTENSKGEKVMHLDPDKFGEWSAGTEDKGKNLRRVWVYDEDRGGFHRWDGKRWANFTNNHTVRINLWAAVSKPHQKRPHFKVLMDRQKGAVLDAVQLGISREMDLVIPGKVPVNNGVFDLGTGKVNPHNPETDTHRNIIPRRFREDWSTPHCMELVRGWFSPGGNPQLDDDNLELLLDAFGMILSGRAQKHRPLVFLWGQSGTGKGGTQKIIDYTLGAQVAPMSALSSLFNNRNGGNHDALLAKLILHQQLVVMGSEIRGIARDSLFQNTGDEKVSARFPGAHGAMVEGYLRCGVIISTTEPPEIPSDRGGNRRTVAIGYNNTEIADDDRRDPNDDECDALLTLGLRKAMDVGKRGYRAPRTVAAIEARFAAQTDPLREYIRNLYTDGRLRGLSCHEIADEYNTNNADAPRKVTHIRVQTVIEAKTTGLPEAWGTKYLRKSVENKQYARHFAHPISQPPTDAEMDTWIRRVALEKAIGGMLGA